MNTQRHIFLSLFAVIMQGTTYSQNLVPNSGFESVTCTSALTSWPVEYCEDWFNVQYTLSTDIFHPCITDPLFDPSVFASYGSSLEGNGMAGFIPLMVKPQVDSREIMMVKLTDTLVKDSSYCVSFWVKNARVENAEYGINSIGIKFTEDTLQEIQIYETPDFKSPDKQMLDGDEWIEISGHYIAKGGETFLSLGTFGERGNISWYFDGNDYFSTGFPAFLYYFVDKVNVYPCEMDFSTDVLLQMPNVFTPDGDGINDYFELKMQNIAELEIQIINRWGEIVFVYDPFAQTWDGSGLSAGVYFLKASGFDNFGNMVDLSKIVTLIK